MCYNINNRWDDGDSLVNILAVVGSSQESRDFSREWFKFRKYWAYKEDIMENIRDVYKEVYKK